MMDYGFANYKSDLIFKAGDAVQTVRIDKGSVRELPLVAADNVGLLMRKGDKKEAFEKVISVNDVAAPIKKGQVIGQIIIKKAGQEVAKTDLVAGADVEEASMWEMFKRTVESWMTFAN